ncbi:transmembrane efflux protein [Halobacteriovorax marinus SJ]|uniref:Transmembrane efflux protein n=2 Tax=Halobacteriovorax marinus TaxID=97084 RepID=E1WYH7_HALMS|nr:transmembrane efflux protein [Halobacteriovorax marinus SJ]
MNVTIPEAGYYISSYALGVVIGAPLLTIFGRTLPPRKMLIYLMAIFAVFNGVSALAPNSISLILLRFCSGLPHGAFFGVGAVVAGKISAPGKEASSFAAMMSGLTISNIIGVPFGTYLGQATSWRFSFALVGLIGLLAILCIYIWVPKIKHEAPKDLSHDFKIFKNPRLWYIIAVMSIGFGAFFAWFSYITPILLKVTNVSQGHIPYVLAFAGVGMTFGNWLGGKLGDTLSPIKAGIFLLVSMIIILTLDASLAQYKIPTYILTFLTGANAMALVAPLQLLLINNAKESPFLGASLGQAAFNVGNSIGALLGGLPIAAGYILSSSWWVGVVLAFLGLLIILKLKSFRINDIQEEVLEVVN